MVNIHLRRMGKKKEPYYRIVVADSRKARDGRFIEILGSYDPTGKKETSIDFEKYKEWVGKGAQPTNRVKKIMKFYEEGTLKGKVIEKEIPAEESAEKDTEEKPDTENGKDNEETA